MRTTEVVTVTLARVCRRPRAQCAARQARLEQDLGVDSLGLLELVETLQARLHITVPDEVTARIRTVADLQDAVTALVTASFAPTPEGRSSS